MNRAVASNTVHANRRGRPRLRAAGNATIDVEVFDSAGGDPGAKVFVREDVAGAFSLVDSVTSSAGAVTLTAGAVGETGDSRRAEHDLFTTMACRARASASRSKTFPRDAPRCRALLSTAAPICPRSTAVADPLARVGQACPPYGRAWSASRP
jgi:hypothetical protein